MEEDSAPLKSTHSYEKRGAAWYCVAVLLISYVLSYVDRAVLTTLVEPIQRDLSINDTSIALMHGFAFAIFYVTLGIPMGYLADRVNRKRLVAVCILLWSFMTVMCGMARSFGQLFAARIGVGIGEAGLSPSTYSLISDYFPPEKRSFALGVYQIGVYIGSGLAIMVGGVVVGFTGHTEAMTIPVLGEVRSWQLVFMIVGAPGLLVALLALTIREPTRRMMLGVTGRASWSGFKEAFGDVWAMLRARPALFSLHFIGFAMCGVPLHVCLLWARPFLSREFGLAPSTASYAVGMTMLVFATIGTVVGSLASDTLLKRGYRDGPIRVGIAAAGAVLVPIALLPVSSSVVMALCALAGLLALSPSPFGGAAGALMLITPARISGQMAAIYLLALNLVGLTFAPVMTGLMTDYVFRDQGALGLSMALVASAGALTSLICLCFLRKRYLEATATITQG